MEQKSARERYIRVAAITMVISEGRANICAARTHEKQPISSASRLANKNLQRQMHLDSAGQSTFFIVSLKGKQVPFRSRYMNTYEMKQ